MAGPKEKLLISAAIAGLALAGMASATTMNESINYNYDARGRLVNVVRSGSVNNNVAANYTYDKANNRTNVSVASPNSPP